MNNFLTLNYPCHLAMFIMGLGILGCVPTSHSSAQEVWGFKVVHAYPHDSDAFTQGLIVIDDQMYEGTGIEGKSTLRKTDYTTGKILQSVPLDPRLFGEGIAVKDDLMYQLTWKHELCLVYNLKTFQLVGNLHYTGEGWGLAYDGKHLIRSDGSKTLYFHDPKTFAVEREVFVRPAKGGNTWRFNELEYVKGEIWANIYYEDRIVRISPKDGKVLGTIEFETLYRGRSRSEHDVMNGIAYDEKNDRLFVTGKLWPKIYEVKVGKEFFGMPR